MGIKYSFESCFVCHRTQGNSHQPDICDSCTNEGYVYAPYPDPQRKAGFWKTLWLMLTYKPYRKI